MNGKSEKKYAQAIYDFKASHADELSLKAGDVIQIMNQIDTDWVYARSLMFNKNKPSGMLPINHVQNVHVPDYFFESYSYGPYQLFAANADFNYETSGDLGFHKTQLIVGQKNIDPNWIYGYYLNDSSKKGIFPITHVNKVYLDDHDDNGESIRRPVKPSTANVYSEAQRQIKPTIAVSVADNRQTVKVIKNFNPERVRHLDQVNKYFDLIVGQRFIVIEKLDSNWYIGENSMGEIGLFPINNVELLDSENFIRGSHDLAMKSDDDPLSQVRLSSTQRRYTFTSADQQSSTNKYARVLYDFHAKHDAELSCLSGEYLLIENEPEPGCEWLKCANYFGGHGEVPKSFVSILTDEQSIRMADDIFKNDRSRSSMSLTSDVFSPPPGGQNQSFNFYEHNSDGLLKKSPSQENAQQLRPRPPPKPRKSFEHQMPQASGSEIKILDNPHVPEAKERNESTSSSSSVNIQNLLIDWSLKSGTPPGGGSSSTPSHTNRTSFFLNESESSSSLNNKQHDNGSSQLDKKERERVNTIYELIETERNYHRELTLCYELFMNEDGDESSPAPVEFNKEACVGKLKPILNISKTLLDSIDAELENAKSSSIDNVPISGLLIRAADSMRTIYAEYARDHNNINSLINKYEQNPSLNEYINTRLNSVKDKIKLVDLKSILIKPVQRIFKYPLFLNRLNENMEPTHPEYSHVKEAIKIFAEMLEFINEYKRRKELVDKYLNSSTRSSQHGGSDLGALMKRFNMKGIKKKSVRLSLQLSTLLGWFNPQVSDETYKRIEVNFRQIEKTIRNFIIDVESFIFSLKCLLDLEKDIFTDILFMIDDDQAAKALYQKLESASNQRRSVDYIDYSQKIVAFILNPLKELANCFHGPNMLIYKRNDKLLDYESALSDFETKTNQNSTINSSHYKETISNLELAKKNYEAINYQLIEELPIICEKSFKMFASCVQMFNMITGKFIHSINKQQEEILKNNQFESMKSNDDRRSSVSLLNKTLLSSFESHFASNKNIYGSVSNLSFTSDSPAGERGDRVSHMYSNLSTTRLSSQSQEERTQLLNKYPVDKLYVVTQNYVANEKLCQLSQTIEDVVGVLKEYDPARQTHIWFVDNGKEKGFIPADALTPYAKLYTNSDLIKLKDATSNSQRDSTTSHSSNSSFENYVTPVTTPDSAKFVLDVLEMTNLEKCCVAMYEFKAFTPNMIDLVVGQKYRIVETCDKKADASWWLVENVQNGHRGYAPHNFLKITE